VAPNKLFSHVSRPQASEYIRFFGNDSHLQVDACCGAPVALRVACRFFNNILVCYVSELMAFFKWHLDYLLQVVCTGLLLIIEGCPRRWNETDAGILSSNADHLLDLPVNNGAIKNDRLKGLGASEPQLLSFLIRPLQLPLGRQSADLTLIDRTQNRRWFPSLTCRYEYDNDESPSSARDSLECTGHGLAKLLPRQFALASHLSRSARPMERVCESLAQYQRKQ
jgi:hypothetical protein